MHGHRYDADEAQRRRRRRRHGARRWRWCAAVARRRRSGARWQGRRDGAAATNTTPRNGCGRTIADATVTWLRVWWWRRATGLEDGLAGRPRGRRFVGRDGRGGGHGSAESQRRRRWRRLFQPPLRATAVRARITSHHRYIGRMASISNHRAGVNARGGARARRTRARCLSVVCCCRVKSRLRTCADGAREPAGGLWQRGRRRVGSYDPRTDARWLRRPLDRRRRCTCAGTGGWWSAA